MKRNEGERRGWILVAVFLLIGLLCVFVAGGMAIRFAPRWSLQANMRSRLDPSSAYFTSQPNFVLQPMDPAILTPPVWIGVFLTPGQVIPTRVPNTPVTPTATSASTQFPPTDRPTSTPTSTATFVFFTPTKSSTSYPFLTRAATATSANSAATATPTATSISTTIETATPTWTATPTAAGTATSTPTNTATAAAAITATPTPTSTPTGTATAVAPLTATPTNTPIYTDPYPGEIGPSPDGNVYNLPAGGSITLDFSVEVNGHDGYDLVYYELPMGSGIWLDWVIVEISDGNNWYTVFNWGNNIADSNSNMNFNILSYPVMTPFPPPEEPDQRDIPSAELYPFPGTGVAIDLDGVVPPGSYSFIRFTCPASIDGVADTDGKMEIDSIVALP
jgi:hypothetical protein